MEAESPSSPITPITEFDPIWSPNGHQIAFARFGANGGDGEIVVINEDGTGEKILTNNDVFDFPGAWSHDGKRIAFTSDRDGDLEVYVMNADGSGVTQLTHNDFTSDIPTAWSPELFVMNVDGSGVTQLTDNPAFDGGDRPGWSPDGKRIVFASTRAGGDFDIFVMNADGSDVTQLTHNDGIVDTSPVWSPNGKHIAFFSTRDGDEEIFVMNADGSGVIQLTHNSVQPDGISPVNDAVPAWRARPLRVTKH